MFSSIQPLGFRTQAFLEILPSLRLIGHSLTLIVFELWNFLEFLYFKWLFKNLGLRVFSSYIIALLFLCFSGIFHGLNGELWTEIVAYDKGRILVIGFTMFMDLGFGTKSTL